MPVDVSGARVGIEAELSELITLLAALADPTRRRIVGRLARGTATVSELVDCFELVVGLLVIG